MEEKLKLELEALKYMYSWYKKPWLWLFILNCISKKSITRYGFCWFWMHYKNGSWQLLFCREDFPSLYFIFYDSNGARSLKNSYWFKPGHLRPRRKILKEAIELCKLRLTAYA